MYTNRANESKGVLNGNKDYLQNLAERKEILITKSLKLM